MFRAVKTFELESKDDNPIPICRVQLRPTNQTYTIVVCELSFRLGWGLDHVVRYKYWERGNEAFDLLVGAVAHCVLADENINRIHRIFRSKGVEWFKRGITDAAE